MEKQPTDNLDVLKLKVILKIAEAKSIKKLKKLLVKVDNIIVKQKLNEFVEEENKALALKDRINFKPLSPIPTKEKQDDRIVVVYRCIKPYYHAKSNEAIFEIDYLYYGKLNEETSLITIGQHSWYLQSEEFNQHFKGVDFGNKI